MKKRRITLSAKKRSTSEAENSDKVVGNLRLQKEIVEALREQTGVLARILDVIELQ